MRKAYECPPAVPLAQSLCASRRELARQHGLDPCAFDRYHAQELRKDGRTFYKMLGPGQQYNELANVVKDLLPILPAQVRARHNPHIARRRAPRARAVTAPGAARARRERAAAATRRELLKFERRHVVERARAFDGFSKLELHQTLEQLGAAPPPAEGEEEDADPLSVRNKGEYKELLASTLGRGRAPGLEREAQLR
eukprot:g1395.t1